MNWRKINAVCLESDDKKWLIAKYKVRGEWVYQLTRVGSPSESVLIAGSAQACKELTTSTTLGGGGSEQG